MNIKWENKARELIVPLKIGTDVKFNHTGESSLNSLKQSSKLNDCFIPKAKSICGHWNLFFIYDENLAIPLITNNFKSELESTVINLLNIPSEIDWYMNNSHKDLNTLIEDAIPVIAEILYYQHQLFIRGFDTFINREYALRNINDIDIKKLVSKIPLYNELM